MVACGVFSEVDVSSVPNTAPLTLCLLASKSAAFPWFTRPFPTTHKPPESERYPAVVLLARTWTVWYHGANMEGYYS